MLHASGVGVESSDGRCFGSEDGLGLNGTRTRIACERPDAGPLNQTSSTRCSSSAWAAGEPVSRTRLHRLGQFESGGGVTLRLDGRRNELDRSRGCNGTKSSVRPYSATLHGRCSGFGLSMFRGYAYASAIGNGVAWEMQTASTKGCLVLKKIHLVTWDV
jgi:hypothetical protein